MSRYSIEKCNTYSWNLDTSNPRQGVVTFCWTPVSLFFDYAMSPG